MSSVLHRTTKQFIASANTPDYPLIDWIVNPDLTAVVGFASKYWVITGDVVTLMDQAARDVVDATELIETRDNAVNIEIDNLEGLIRAFAQVVVDEINLLRTEHALPDRTLAQVKTAIRNKVGS